MSQPPMIHDFYGFPDELFAFRYPAVGSPELAREIVDVVRPSRVALDEESWGIDHGTWSVLAHLFPAADIPVVQLSIHADAPLTYHLELGARLAPLRERGVFILGSGNVVHNLHRIDWSYGDRGFDWSDQFDAHVRSVMTSDPSALVNIEMHPNYRLASPTAEHFLPLAYIAGLGTADGEVAQSFAVGRTLGSLSMTSYLLGMEPPVFRLTGTDAQSMPKCVPPEQTNI